MPFPAVSVMRACSVARCSTGLSLGHALLPRFSHRPPRVFGKTPKTVGPAMMRCDRARNLTRGSRADHAPVRVAAVCRAPMRRPFVLLFGSCSAPVRPPFGCCSASHTPDPTSTLRGLLAGDALCSAFRHPVTTSRHDIARCWRAATRWNEPRHDGWPHREARRSATSARPSSSTGASPRICPRARSRWAASARASSTAAAT
jgi:hypothetical protein